MKIFLKTDLSLEIHFPKNEKCEVTSDRKIESRDIRKLQLAMILSGNKQIVSMNEVEENLNLLKNFTDEEAGKLVKYFDIFNVKNEEVFYDFSEEVVKLLETRIGVENIYTFAIDEINEEYNEVLEVTIKDFLGIKNDYSSICWAFRNVGVYKVRDLVAMSKSELLKVRNVGKSRVNQIQEKLESVGLQLAD